jgi:N-acetylglucosamine-6-phosphate deacetylase
MKKIKSDKIILDDRIFSGCIYFENGRIIEVTEKEYPVAEVYDMTGYYVSAGFIDIHTHGGGGNAFE